MKPTKEYNGRSTIKMYNADCMELMNSGKQWDLAIVDPPYGIGASKRRGDTGKNSHIKQKDYKYGNWDDKAPNDKYFDELIRVSENQIIWGGNYFNLPPSSCYLVWNKKNGDNLYSDCELAWGSFNTSIRMFSWRWHGFLQEKHGDDKEQRIHPTQKPVQLYKWILTKYANEGDTILDTHGGSMSIAIACWDLGFDLDICELDTDYFNDAVKRFEQHISQTQLF